MKGHPKERIKNALFSPAGFAVILIVLICIGAVFLVQMYGKAYREDGYDFTGYLKATAEFLHGGNPYRPDTKFPLIYPLFLCIVMIPFNLAPYWLSNFAWFAVNASSIFLSSLYFLRILLPSCSPRQSIVLTAVPLLVTLNIVQSNLLNGQINHVVILLCVLFLYALLRDRKLLAAIWLAAAVSIKLTPLIFLVYLTFRKDFRTIVWTALFSCIFTVVLPYCFVGPRLVGHYESYFHTFFAAKLLSSGPASAEPAFNLASFLRIVLLDAGGLPVFVLASLLTLIPAGFLQIKLGKRQQSPPVAALLMLLYMVSILFISPMSETHHMAFLFLATVVMVTTALLGDRRSDFQAGALSLLGVSCGIVLGKCVFSGYALAIAVCYGFIYIVTLREASGSLLPLFASPPPAGDR
jgi:hypothetical protein